jgi:hypothetical protein
LANQQGTIPFTIKFLHRRRITFFRVTLTPPWPPWNENDLQTRIGEGGSIKQVFIRVARFFSVCTTYQYGENCTNEP